MRLPAPVRVREGDGWAAFQAFDSVICDLTRRNQPPLPFDISKRRRNLGPMDGGLVALLPGGNKATCVDFKCRYRERNPRDFRVSCAKVETRCLMKRPTFMHWVLLRHAL